MLIDWNFACLGNPLADVAAWLPSLHAEGGPAPEEVLAPDEVAASLAAFAGYFGRHGGAARDPEAPHVRPLQRKQAGTALPWAARALGLPPPLGLPPAHLQRRCTCNPLLESRPWNEPSRSM